ncbi:hypothetical protein GCM10009530_62010 [Microbispora corallina]|uniref:Beta-lactamase-related domain-containing protein n=2 Tax=Microbispora corallina TaxID=83302 RepID=A0ABQ4G8L5_9ACTN|nr:hypothetical protein Mco01_63860 [Microbispora corallina]
MAAASGYADLATRQRATPGDHLRAGSITKMFTATVVLQLVGEHRLRLDDTVEQRLPGLVRNGRAITVRHLLDHTSGLFGFDNDPRFLAPYLHGEASRPTPSPARTAPGRFSWRRTRIPAPGARRRRGPG